MNKTFIVTGASKGIGSAIVELYAENNYNVLINYNKSSEKAMELYEKLKAKGLSVRVFKADVSKREEVDSMIKYCIDEFGSIYGLVNNAGVAASKMFVDITEDEWDQMINVNLKGVYNCTQSALKHMMWQQSGKIINIASIWGLVGASCEVSYSASKAGIIGLTKALAKELGAFNINVNCIAPGVIETDMIGQFNEEEIEQLKEQTPLARLGTPLDIAKCALYLASDESAFITGQVISPNGGFVI